MKLGALLFECPSYKNRGHKTYSKKMPRFKESEKFATSISTQIQPNLKKLCFNISPVKLYQPAHRLPGVREILKFFEKYSFLKSTKEQPADVNILK